MSHKWGIYTLCKPKICLLAPPYWPPKILTDPNRRSLATCLSRNRQWLVYCVYRIALA